MSIHTPFDLEKALKDLVQIKRPLLEYLLERGEGITLLPGERISDWTYGINRHTFARWKRNVPIEDVSPIEFMAAMNGRLKGETIAQFSEISVRLEDSISQAMEDRAKQEGAPRDKRARGWPVLPVLIVAGMLAIVTAILVFASHTGLHVPSFN